MSLRLTNVYKIAKTITNGFSVSQNRTWERNSTRISVYASSVASSGQRLAEGSRGHAAVKTMCHLGGQAGVKLLYPNEALREHNCCGSLDTSLENFTIATLDTFTG